jgi:hypothetical protein
MKKEEFLKLFISKKEKSIKFYDDKIIEFSDKSVISLFDVFLSKQKSNYNFIKSKVESYNSLKDYDMFFITLTLSSEINNTFNKISSYYSKMIYSKNESSSFNLFFEKVIKMKTNINKKNIRYFQKEDYFYFKSLETNKKGLFHSHLCVYIKKNKSDLFLKKIYQTYNNQKIKKIGRVEIVTNNENIFKKTYYSKALKKHFINKEDYKKSGEFIYLKKLKKENDVGKYISKYAIKSSKFAYDLSSSSKSTSSYLSLFKAQSEPFLLDAAFFSFSKKRRIVFSKTFTRYSLNFENSDGKKLYNCWDFSMLLENIPEPIFSFHKRISNEEFNSSLLISLRSETFSHELFSFLSSDLSFFYKKNKIYDSSVDKKYYYYKRENFLKEKYEEYIYYITKIKKITFYHFLKEFYDISLRSYFESLYLSSKNVYKKIDGFVVGFETFLRPEKKYAVLKII